MSAWEARVNLFVTVVSQRRRVDERGIVGLTSDVFAARGTASDRGGVG